MAKDDWEFCDKNPGCALGKGHGGECRFPKS